MMCAMNVTQLGSMMAAGAAKQASSASAPPTLGARAPVPSRAAARAAPAAQRA